MNDKRIQEDKRKHFKQRQDLAFHLDDAPYALLSSLPCGILSWFSSNIALKYILFLSFLVSP